MTMNAKKQVTILSSIMVRPTDETPIRRLWLSRLDMMAGEPRSHTRLPFIYQPNNAKNTQSHIFNNDILKKSFGKALVLFYTLAGRLRFNESNGRYEIDCNAEGALFIVAETKCALTDLGSEINPDTELIAELFATCDYSKGLFFIPVLMVQLTRFKCGGVCLGFSTIHHVTDGSAVSKFVNLWANLTKGVDLGVMPVHDRLEYLAPRDPPQFESLDSSYIERPLPPSDLYGKKASTTNNNFVLSKSHIDVLKQEAMSSQELSGHKITTFVVLAGHVWRSACKARNLSKDQDVKLYILVDGRSILKDPALPLGYAGNAIIYVSCKAKAGDIVHKPLWYAISKVCDTMKKVKDAKYFRSVIDYIEIRPSLESLIRREQDTACPNLWVNSLVKMPFNEADFGWGAPKAIRPVGAKRDGQSVFFPSENDGNWLLSITLYSIHMISFERYVYEFQARLTSMPDTTMNLQPKEATRCKL